MRATGRHGWCQLREQNTKFHKMPLVLLYGDIPKWGLFSLQTYIQISVVFLENYNVYLISKDGRTLTVNFEFYSDKENLVLRGSSKISSCFKWNDKSNVASVILSCKQIGMSSLWYILQCFISARKILPAGPKSF